MDKIKHWKFLVISSFLLSSCTQTTQNVLTTPTIVKTLNSTNKNNPLYDKYALAAPDPKQCQDGNDICHFEYLNQRSFSILKNVKNNNDNSIGGAYGTGWFLDREVGTNNFWIATNIHVGTNLTEEELAVKDLKQPEIVSFKIGKQDLLKENNNKRVDVLLDTNYKDVQFEKTYYDDNNRLLLQSHTYSYDAPTSVNKTDSDDVGYFLNLKRLTNSHYFQLLQLNYFGRISPATYECYLYSGINTFSQLSIRSLKSIFAPFGKN